MNPAGVKPEKAKNGNGKGIFPKVTKVKKENAHQNHLAALGKNRQTNIPKQFHLVVRIV